MGSIVDLGMPAPGGAFDEHHPPDAALIGDCVHCGFCLPTCPTYVLWGEEMDSPRGRIYLMKEGLEGEPMSDSMVSHWDACLGCMACVTACPSGVQYDTLIEQTRAQVERNHDRSPQGPGAARADLLAVPAPASGCGCCADRCAALQAHRARPGAASHRPARRGWRRSSPRWRAWPRVSAGREPLPRAHPRRGRAPRGRRHADRLRAGRVLPRRERRDRPGAPGRGLRRRRARAAGLLRRAVGAQRPRGRGAGASPAGSSTPSRRPASSTSSSTPPAAARR